MIDLVRTLLPWTIICLFGAAASVAFAFLYRLKTRHRAVWEELGEPMLIWNQTWENTRKLSRYGPRLRSLRDPVLNRLEWAGFVLGALYAVAVVVWFWLG